MRLRQNNSILIFRFLSVMLFAFLIKSDFSCATVLWAGGEDVDFPNGATGAVSTCVAGSCWTGATRGGYSRTCIWTTNGGNTPVLSNTFSGGAVTSAWLSFRMRNNFGANRRWSGFGKSGTSAFLGIGTSPSSGTKVALKKYDGTTLTQIAEESGNSLAGGPAKLDMQIINYGAAGTVNIYVNGAATPALTYTGDIRVGAIASWDSFALVTDDGWPSCSSEFLVADTDTRSMSVVTLNPNANGDTNQWTGTQSDLNESYINDATAVGNDAVGGGQNFQCHMSDLPAGNFKIEGIKIAARTAQNGGNVTSIAVGVKTNATVSVPAPVALTSAWTTTETYYSSNPVMAAPWAVSEINSLQLNLQSSP